MRSLVKLNLFKYLKLTILRHRFIYTTCALLLFCPLPVFCADPANNTLPDLSTVDPGEIISLGHQMMNGTLLDYFNAREKLLNTPYDELSDLLGHAKENNVPLLLEDPLKKILRKKQIEEIFCAVEETYLDNTPPATHFPFYPEDANKHQIQALDPEAEQFYFDNLRLTAHKNDWVQRNESLWSAEGLKSAEPSVVVRPEAPALSLDGLADDLKERWQVRIPSDHINHFPQALRQFRKKFPESVYEPVVYQGTVIVRNLYRLFCQDLKTGKELWSLTGRDSNGQEYYQTLPEPDTRPFGYGILLKDGGMYAQLNHDLVAVDVKDVTAPRIVWTKGLGEYALAMRPVVSEGVVVVILVNARMELWASGFDTKTGDLVWSDYIGITSFLSAASSLTLLEGGKAYLATNHGILLKIDAKTGRVAWIKKYIPKKYSVSYYILNMHRVGYFNAPNVPYDTQALELGHDGLLYYKPRESDYLYLLDPVSGEEKKRVLIDTKKYYLLRARDGRAFFVNKNSRDDKKTAIVVMDLKNGAELFAKDIPPGVLDGVDYLDDRSMVFKLGTQVHFLSYVDGHDVHRAFPCDVPGWLLPSEGGLLFVGKDQRLRALDYLKTVTVNAGVNVRVEKKIDAASEFLDGLSKALASGSLSAQVETVHPGLLRSAATVDIAPQSLTSIIIKNVRALKEPSWNDLLKIFKDRFGEKFIDYLGIKIRFDRFLAGYGLIKLPEEMVPVATQAVLPSNESLKVIGNYLYLLPMIRVGDTPQPPYFLVWNYDQLFCVQESGKILWQRKMFYRPGAEPRDVVFKYNWDLTKKRLMADDLNAYLAGDTVIVNDHVNVVAMRASDGKYLWSATNENEDIPLENYLMDMSPLFTTYGIQPQFVKKAMYQTMIKGDKIYLVHRDRLSILDIKSGFCQKAIELKRGGFVEAALFNGQIILLTLDKKKIIVLNEDLTIDKEIPLDFSKNDQTHPQLYFWGKDLILRFDSDIYIVDPQKGVLAAQKHLEEGRHRFETSGNLLFDVQPFKIMEAYVMKEGQMVRVWCHALDDSKRRAYFPYPAKGCHFLYTVNDMVITPEMVGGQYVLTALDMKTGKKRWSAHIKKFGGFFWNLSEYVQRAGTMYFMMSVTSDKQAITEENLPKIRRVNVETRFIGLNLKDGSIQYVEHLPTTLASWPVRSYGFERVVLGESKDALEFTVHGKLLRTLGVR